VYICTEYLYGWKGILGNVMGGDGGDMWSEQKHENLSLIRAFVINHQGILNLTTDDNLIAVDVYVAYRKPFPDKETVNRVKRELKKNNIEYSELAEISMENCNFADSSSEEGNSQ
jgi:hypothetical protein